MASQTSICNQALLALGEKTITSIDDDTNAARICKAHYEPIRLAVQEEHPWTFCTKWENLAKLADPPLSEFANAFAIPADTLRVVFVGQDYDHPEEYRVEGENIVTNLNECKAQLIYNEPDVSRWSPLFVQAFTARLTADMAIAITEGRTVAEFYFGVYQQKMLAAVNRDNAQGRPRRIRSKWLQRAR